MLTSCESKSAEWTVRKCPGGIRFRSVANSLPLKSYSGRVFALDIFRAGFEQDSMSKEGGRRYRKMVLQFGGSQPEMKTLTDYLGREPSTRPYFEFLGIVSSDDDEKRRK